MAKAKIDKPHLCKRCRRRFETPHGLRQHLVWHAKLDKKSGKTGKNEHRSAATARAERNPDGTITKAGSKALAQGNAGGNRYSGRTDALRVLDSMLKEAKCQEKLKDGLRRELLKNPVGFFKQIVMPLVPKESLVRMEGTMQAATLMHIFHAEAPTNGDGDGPEPPLIDVPATERTPNDAETADAPADAD